jgi:hypothetical protein
VDGKNDMTVLTSTLSPGHPNLPAPTVEGFVKAITTVAGAVKVGELIANGVNALPQEDVVKPDTTWGSPTGVQRDGFNTKSFDKPYTVDGNSGIRPATKQEIEKVNYPHGRSIK